MAYIGRGPSAVDLAMALTSGPLADALSAKVTAADITAAISTLTAGTPAQLDTFLEVYTRFLNDENVVSSLATLVGQKADTTTVTAHTARTDNPHSVNSAQVGLGNVANKSEAQMVASGAIADALAGKTSPADVATAVSTGIGSLTAGSPAALDTFLEVYNRFLNDEGALTALTNTVAAKAASADLTAHTVRTDNPHGTTASQVGAYSTTQADAKTATALTTANTYATDTAVALAIALG